jgi:hypothetical protein
MGFPSKARVVSPRNIVPTLGGDIPYQIPVTGGAGGREERGEELDVFLYST